MIAYRFNMRIFVILFSAIFFALSCVPLAFSLPDGKQAGGAQESQKQVRCDSNGRCSTSGKGRGCLFDTDCATSKRCDPTGRCVLGAKGVTCDSDEVCLIKRCGLQTCALGETLDVCSSNDTCGSSRFCDSATGKCVHGGKGSQCFSDQDCTVKACSVDNPSKCILGITGGRECKNDTDCDLKGGSVCEGDLCMPYPQSSISCEKNLDCSSPAGRICDSQNRCVPSQTGSECIDDRSCRDRFLSHTQCSEGRCVTLTGAGPSECSADLECKFGKRCNDQGVCVISRDGRYACAQDAECKKHCNTDGQCAYNGLREECTDNSACKKRCDYSGHCAFWGDLKECNEDQECYSGQTMQSVLIPERYMLNPKAIFYNFDTKISDTLRGSSVIIGKKDAPVTLVAFQDLTCSMCRKAFRETLMELHQTLVTEGKLKVEYRELPLGFVKKDVELARAAKCAHKQNKYVEFLNTWYETKWEERKLENLAAITSNLGFNSAEFEQCRNDPESLKLVKQDYELAQKFNLNGTPEFFVNGYKISGAQSLEEFQQIISLALKER